VDERKLIDWLVETTDETWELIGRGAKSAGQMVVVAGKSTGKVIVLGSGAAAGGVAGAGSQVWSGISSVADTATDFVADTYHAIRGKDEAEPEALEAGLPETTAETLSKPAKPGLKKLGTWPVSGTFLTGTSPNCRMNV